MLEYDIYTLTAEEVKRTGQQEVTTSRTFIHEGEPDPEGLASYEIFGIPGSDQRKKQWAYSKLNDIFVNPHCMFELKSLKRQYDELVRGISHFYYEDGDIHRIIEGMEVPKGAPQGTGVRFLYKIWDQLDFEYKDIPVGVRSNRLRFFKHLKKKQVFIDKLPIIPPFYRDVDMAGGGKKNEFNMRYERAINLASTIEVTRAMTGVTNDVSDSHISMINLLTEFHEWMIKMIGGRKGFMHKYVMGKAADYSARLVLSGADMSDIKSPDDMAVTFEYSLVPLFAAIKCFAPFIVHEIRNIINEFMAGSEFIWINDAKGEPIRKKVSSDWKLILTSDHINSLIEVYHESIDHRLDPVTVPTEDGEELPIGYITSDGGSFKVSLEPEELVTEVGKRIEPMRLIHLFYMAAYRIMGDKHVYITRYPIEDHNNTYPSKVNIIPYKRNGSMTVNGTVYPKFPIIDMVEDTKHLSAMFTDSLVIFPGYLGALGGDFDGDMVSVLGVHSIEGNLDAAKFISSPANLLAINGSTTRELGVLAEHTIFAMTS